MTITKSQTRLAGMVVIKEKKWFNIFEDKDITH